MAAPAENVAVDALKTVQALPPKQLDALITAEVGNPMLGVFHSLAKAQNPDGDADTLARATHLMVLAYLMRREVAEKK